MISFLDYEIGMTISIVDGWKSEKYCSHCMMRFYLKFDALLPTSISEALGTFSKENFNNT